MSQAEKVKNYYGVVDEGDIVPVEEFTSEQSDSAGITS